MHGLALVVVQLLFKLRHALNLVFHAGVARDALLFLEIAEELINVASAALQNGASALKDLDFGLELFQRLLASLVLRVFLPEICRILSKIITLQVLCAFELLVLVFTLVKLFFYADFFLLKPL